MYTSSRLYALHKYYRLYEHGQGVNEQKQNYILVGGKYIFSYTLERLLSLPF